MGAHEVLPRDSRQSGTLLVTNAQVDIVPQRDPATWLVVPGWKSQSGDMALDTVDIKVLSIAQGHGVIRPFRPHLFAINRQSGPAHSVESKRQQVSAIACRRYLLRLPRDAAPSSAGIVLA